MQVGRHLLPGPTDRRLAHRERLRNVSAFIAAFLDAFGSPLAPTASGIRADERG
jgi:hypothetical protein